MKGKGESLVGIDSWDEVFVVLKNVVLSNDQNTKTILAPAK